MSDFVLDASLTLQWFFEDETDRKYSLGVLTSLSEKRALVPLLWFYEVARLRNLPIDAAQQTPSEILELPAFARLHGLTNYDAAYLALAQRSAIPLATTDRSLRVAAVSASVGILAG